MFIIIICMLITIFLMLTVRNINTSSHNTQSKKARKSIKRG